jgi:hypothetical protein
MARCIIGTSFAGPSGNLVTDEQGDEGKDPNLEIFEMQMLEY